MKQPCVYILASKRNGTLYVGVKSDLPKGFGSIKTIKPKASQSGTVSTNWCGMKPVMIWERRSRARKRLKNGSALGKSASSQKPIQNGRTCTIGCCSWATSSVVFLRGGIQNPSVI